jgi:hypothetical protein
MSLYDYNESKKIGHFSFAALLMAAMRQADSINIQTLKEGFPDIFLELSERYNAPGGYLKGEEPED